MEKPDYNDQILALKQEVQPYGVGLFHYKYTLVDCNTINLLTKWHSPYKKYCIKSIGCCQLLSTI